MNEERPKFPPMKYGAPARYSGGKLSKSQKRSRNVELPDPPDEWVNPFGKVTFNPKNGTTKIEYFDGVGPRPIRLKKKYRKQ